MTPGPIRKLIRRCVERDRAERLRDIGDARFEIKEALGAPSDDVVEREAITQPALWQRPPVAVPTLLAAMLLAGLAGWSLTSTTPSSQPLSRFSVNLPESDSLGGGATGSVGVALSPNGERLVYPATRDNEQLLFLRTRDQLEAVPLRGTNGAMLPFFSPDGEWVGFFDGNALKKISLAGGAPVTLCETGGRFGASWGEDDTIVFASGSQVGLMQVSGNGGEPRPLTTPDDGRHLWPTWLPGSEAVIYTTTSAAAGGNPRSNGRVMLLDLATGEERELTTGTSPRYSPTGHLLFTREFTLWAVPFDLDRLVMTGEPAPVTEGVAVRPGGLAHYDVADDGTLVYRPATGTPEGLQLVSVDRSGRVTVMTEDRRRYADVRVSPDGSRVAIELQEDGTEIWIFDPTRGTLTRFTVGGGQNPVWSPDGSRITFSRLNEGLYWKPADGRGQAERLTTSEVGQRATSWSPDGQVLALVQGGAGDIWMLPLDGEPSEFIATEFSEQQPTFSPDGEWLAYQSDETGQAEVYVQPYPGPGGRLQISTQGGREPLWGPDGRELFYRDARGDLM